MNNKLLNVFMFTVGAAIGSAVTWKIVKTRYEQIAQEEIDSVKEEYISLMQSMKKKLNVYEGPQDSDAAKADGKYDEYNQEIIDYYNIAGMYSSSEVDDCEEIEEGGTRDEDDVPYINGPYVISPEDFAISPPGYNTQPLDYFTDGVLADSWGEKLDIDETIGEDALTHFGEYADDIVYVRNERTEIDYEVARDPRTYEEAIRTNPNPYYGK